MGFRVEVEMAGGLLDAPFEGSAGAKVIEVFEDVRGGGADGLGLGAWSLEKRWRMW